MNTQVQKIELNVPVMDLELLKSLVKRMGWTIATKSPVASVNPNKAEALNRLRGCVSLPTNFDYRKEMEQELSAKYERL